MNLRTEAGHFWIRFDNGYEISVFNGYGSHTENHFGNGASIEECLNKKFWESETAEIGIFKDNALITDKFLNHDDLVKTVDLKELIQIINMLNNME